jgi:glucosamine-6-phosphate deaminase
VDIIVQDTAQQAVVQAVKDWVLAIVGGERVVGLATGSTVVPFYREWAASMAGHPAMRELSTFNLDEYYGIGQDHPGTFRRFMDGHCFGPLGMSAAQIHFLPADPLDDVDRACVAYEEDLRRLGGIGPLLLGIGGNAHLAFNEPGTALDSRTHLCALTDETRRANQAGFPGGPVPERALTMGIGTIMEARELFLLAFGASKRAAVAAALRGPVTDAVPASALQRHQKVRVYLDREAAAGLD